MGKLRDALLVVSICGLLCEYLYAINWMRNETRRMKAEVAESQFRSVPIDDYIEAEVAWRVEMAEWDKMLAEFDAK